MDPSPGHGQHPRQRGHDDRHEGEVHVVLAALRRGRLPQLQEPEPVDWAMEEASDDEDDAPMPELIDMPPAPASAPRMSNLEHCIALRLVATRRSHRPKKKKKQKNVTNDYRHMWPVLLCRCLRCVSCPGFPGYKKKKKQIFFWWFLGRW